jgi:Ca2+-binding RTX toxin-like protein
MHHLNELAVVAGATSADYSNEATDSFTITRDGVSFVISGTFTYTANLPDPDGQVALVEIHNGLRHYDFSFNTDPSLVKPPPGFTGFTIADFNAAFSSGNALTVAETLLAGDSKLIAESGSTGNRLYGFGGNDSMIGGFNDSVFGGAGNDSLSGGNDSRLYGGPGNDLLYANFGMLANQVLDGGTGNNTASFLRSFTSVSVTLNGNHPVTPIFGNGAHDTLINIQNLIGGLASDTFVGDRRNNLLIGGYGNDVISGGAGNDSIDGSFGTNRLTGGPGRDAFVFDTRLTNALQGSLNIITDFHRGTDKIWLETHIFFPFKYDGPMHNENFISGPHVTHGATDQQFIAYDTVTGNLYFGNNNGSTLIAEFENHPRLHASDFLLITETVLQ